MNIQALMKFNAAEIRNATYQTHPIHRMAFALAGENPDAEIWHVDEDTQQLFTSDCTSLPSIPSRVRRQSTPCSKKRHQETEPLTNG